jgi:hypothetical protein
VERAARRRDRIARERSWDIGASGGTVYSFQFTVNSKEEIKKSKDKAEVQSSQRIAEVRGEKRKEGGTVTQSSQR